MDHNQSQEQHTPLQVTKQVRKKLKLIHSPVQPILDTNTNTKIKKSGYYSRNKEERIKYQIEYNNKNHDNYLDNQKSYYEKNKEAILISRKEKGDVKIVCVCGCEIKKSTQSSHLRTNKHLNLLKSK